MNQFGIQSAKPKKHAPVAAGAVVGESAVLSDLPAESNTAESLMCEVGLAQRFLTLLDGTAETWCFRTFAEASYASGSGHKYAGTLADVAVSLQLDNGNGRGVFVVVNEGGQDKESITRVRALYADFDPPKTKAMPATFALQPHVVIESSPGKHHAYWRVDGLPVEEFTDMQHAIIAMFGSDPSVCDLPRVMRLPGFMHRKGEPFQARIIHESDAPPYSADVIRAAFMPAPVDHGDATGNAAPPAVTHAPSGVVVDTDRHNDALGVTGRMAREVVRNGMSEATAWATILAERARGRWTRYPPDDELRRMFEGAVEKLRSGAWRARKEVPARAAYTGNDNKRFLPDFPPELLALPAGLGQLQRWIHGFMVYPSMAGAGLSALATLTHFAMAHVTVSSYGGLGLNEQYLVLAPTGFGKEKMRRPFALLADALALPENRPAGAGDLWPTMLPRLNYNAVASQQALHMSLFEHPAQTYLSDEFADWLGETGTNSHGAQALAYMMTAYGAAAGSGTVAPPASIQGKYQPVKNPRVLVFATSTAERMLEMMTASQGDSGAINRFVIFVAEQQRLAKRYNTTPDDETPPAGVLDLVGWVSALPKTVMQFDADAWAFYQTHDAEVLDPLKFADHALAGRLNEQAFKLAAMIALSDRRLTIERGDLITAYAIREGLYRRAASLIGTDGAISGMHVTGKAYAQLAEALARHGALYRSGLPKYSRAYKQLSKAEQNTVVAALFTDGVCAESPEAKGTLVYCGQEDLAA